MCYHAVFENSPQTCTSYSKMINVLWRGGVSHPLLTCTLFKLINGHLNSLLFLFFCHFCSIYSDSLERKENRGEESDSRTEP